MSNIFHLAIEGGKLETFFVEDPNRNVIEIKSMLKI